MWYKNLHCTKCVIKQRLLSLSLAHTVYLFLLLCHACHVGAEIILEHGLAELYALFDAFFMRHVDAVMCATDAAADALCVCACACAPVCAFISLLRPCTLCRKTKTAAMKINIRQQ